MDLVARGLQRVEIAVQAAQLGDILARARPRPGELAAQARDVVVQGGVLALRRWRAPRSTCWRCAPARAASASELLVALLLGRSACAALLGLAVEGAAAEAADAAEEAAAARDRRWCRPRTPSRWRQGEDAGMRIGASVSGLSRSW